MSVLRTVPSRRVVQEGTRNLSRGDEKCVCVCVCACVRVLETTSRHSKDGGSGKRRNEREREGGGDIRGCETAASSLMAVPGTKLGWGGVDGGELTEKHEACCSDDKEQHPRRQAPHPPRRVGKAGPWSAPHATHLPAAPKAPAVFLAVVCTPPCRASRCTICMGDSAFAPLVDSTSVPVRVRKPPTLATGAATCMCPHPLVLPAGFLGDYPRSLLGVSPNNVEHPNQTQLDPAPPSISEFLVSIF
jgi:hypothetical protein